jgi:hypothetical protein
MRSLPLSLIAAAAALLSVSAGATVTGGPAATSLGVAVNVDNGFTLYISADDSVLGTAILAGNSWPTTYTASTDLGGGDLYLHLVATDWGAPAAFLGEFTLSDAGYSFINGTQHLLTNTTDWTVRASSFADADQTPVSRGLNGIGPWGTRTGVSGSATWIWSADLCGSCTRYFSTPLVSAVPEPQTYALMGLGLLGLAGVLRRRRVA